MIRYKIKPHMIFSGSLALSIVLCLALALWRAPEAAWPFLASAYAAAQVAAAGLVVLFVFAKLARHVPTLQIPAREAVGTIATLALALGSSVALLSVFAGGIAAMVA